MAKRKVAADDVEETETDAAPIKKKKVTKKKGWFSLQNTSVFGLGVP